MMNDVPEPTLRDVMDHLIRIDRRLDENNEQLRNLGERLDHIEERLGRVEGRLGRVEGRLDGVDGQLRTLRDRMDELERGVADELQDGLGRVVAAVRNLAETKADRSEVAELRADVDALKEAAG